MKQGNTTYNQPQTINWDSDIYYTGDEIKGLTPHTIYWMEYNSIGAREIIKIYCKQTLHLVYEVSRTGKINDRSHSVLFQKLKEIGFQELSKKEMETIRLEQELERYLNKEEK